MLATRILSRINKEFSSDIRLKEFMKYPTIKALSDKIEESDEVDLGLPVIVEDLEIYILRFRSLKCRKPNGWEELRLLIQVVLLLTCILKSRITICAH